MVRIFKIFKKLNKECCDVEDEYIDIDASTNSVVPTSCDYMTKATGGLPSLDSTETHSKTCLCECPGSSIPPESIDRTIKSHSTDTQIKNKKQRVKHNNHRKIQDYKNKSGKTFCNKYLTLYITVATVTCTCIFIAVLIFKYVSPLFQNVTT
ncbi:protein EE8 [Elephantid betaherpesvirus 1]|uniref:Protein EE8 n=2 Tax=Elephantid herpesvirus 1 TaxID=146015 RepID=M4JU82_ELHV1|nr:protein EE8 [Elephantid betaherpesvirus 1]AIH00859.1 protein U45.7 [Elephant endotheliotropic herpesvirus 1B]